MLDPYYVTGLIEGEGTFGVSFNLRKRLSIGIETRPYFAISLNQRDLKLIKSIQAYFSCGGIRFSKRDDTYKYEVKSIKDLIQKIVPHFEKYPLQGAKAGDFDKFKSVCMMVNSNLHLSKKYLPKIIELAYSMNRGGKRKHKKKDLLRELAR